MATVQEDDEWVKYRQMFADVYDQSNYSSPLQSRVMRASHQVLEKRFDATRRFAHVIEVGAGTGEHLGFVRHTYDEYITTDLDPAALRVAEKKSQTHARGALSFDVQPAEKLAYPDSCADRLIAVHVLEHIYYPHLALKEWRRVLKDGGVLSVLIPTDPGLAPRALPRPAQGRRRAGAALRLHHCPRARERLHQPDRPAQALFPGLPGRLVAAARRFGRPEPFLRLSRDRPQARPLMADRRDGAGPTDQPVSRSIR
jgi:SAM-dependent methyltransferase